ncbi:hypothetical protein A0H81_12712 [Grifola frondosa]|uniref:Uncharacterized protein n=1 Tax=Grifola frondosa TaxID=5627 RepID=A0A1C7LX45_GRIFR|nr:hypothetical protein A0H81_12712 [Grifola frondosa]
MKTIPHSLAPLQSPSPLPATSKILQADMYDMIMKVIKDAKSSSFKWAVNNIKEFKHYSSRQCCDYIDNFKGFLAQVLAFKKLLSSLEQDIWIPMLILHAQMISQHCDVTLSDEMEIQHFNVEDHNKIHFGRMSRPDFDENPEMRITNDEDHIDEELCRGDLLVQCYQHVFTGRCTELATLGMPHGARCKGITAMNMMDRVTPQSIAYVAILVHFALSTQSEWSVIDNQFSLKALYYTTLNSFQNADWTAETLRWWNYTVFGITGDASGNESNADSNWPLVHMTAVTRLHIQQNVYCEAKDTEVASAEDANVARMRML